MNFKGIKKESPFCPKKRDPTLRNVTVNNPYFSIYLLGHCFVFSTCKGFKITCGTEVNLGS